MSSGGGLNGGGYQPVPDSPEDHPLELEQGQRQEPERRQGAATNIIATNGVTPEDLKYAIGSFTAVAAPVALTMCIAALVAVTVSTEYSAATQEASMGAYEIFQGANGDSNPMKLGKSLANAVVIVLFIAAATFMIVLLYRYRCMSCLTGYMMFSSATLLGVMGGSFLYTALDKWSIPCDYITFVFVLWNFAAVGVLSIFYQKGLPRIFTQGYLVATSVIMAWQLSRIDEWTGWSLLVVLALYDLCAVRKCWFRTAGCL
jgi:presenilin 1